MRRLPLLLLGLFLTAMLALSACGGSGSIRINDRGVITEMDSALPKTVGELLYEAEIVLRDGDEVSPSADTLIRSPQEITVLRENVVLLTVDGSTKTVVICGGTVGDLLRREGIELSGDRRVNYELDRYLTDGMELWVSERANVTIQHDGLTLISSVEAKTVGEALAECGVELGLDDRVSPSLDSPVSYGMEITVGRVRYETLVQTETIGFETVYEKDESLPAGTEQVSVSGQNGQRNVTYRVTLVDGREDAREAVSEEILVPPINELIKTGPKDPSLVTVVSKKAYYDCDGSGHGYYEITYSDGSVEYEPF